MEDSIQIVFLILIIEVSLLCVMVGAILYLTLRNRKPDGNVEIVDQEIIIKEKEHKGSQTQTADDEINAEPGPCASSSYYNAGEVGSKTERELWEIDQQSLYDTGGLDIESTDFREQADCRHSTDRPPTEDEEGCAVDEHAAVGKEGDSVDEHASVGNEDCVVDEHAAVGKEGCVVDEHAAVGIKRCGVDEDVAVGKEGGSVDEHVAVGKEVGSVDEHAAVGEEVGSVDEHAAVGIKGCGVDEQAAVGKEGCGVEENATVETEGGGVEEHDTVGKEPGSIDEHDAVGKEGGIVDEHAAVGKEGGGVDEDVAVGKEDCDVGKQYAVGKDCYGVDEHVAVGKECGSVDEHVAVGKEGGSVHEHVAVRKKACIVDEDAAVGKEGGGVDEHLAVGKEGCAVAEDAAVVKEDDGVDDYVAIEKEGCAVDEDVAVGKEGGSFDEHTAVGKEGGGVDEHVAVGKEVGCVDEHAAVGIKGCGVDEQAAVGKEGCGVEENATVETEGGGVEEHDTVGKEPGSIDEHDAVGKEGGIVDEHAAVGKEGGGVDEDVAVGKEGCGVGKQYAVGKDCYGVDEHVAVGKECGSVDEHVAVGKEGGSVHEHVAVRKKACIVDEYVAVGKEGGGVDEHLAVGKEGCAVAEDAAVVKEDDGVDDYVAIEKEGCAVDEDVAVGKEGGSFDEHAAVGKEGGGVDEHVAVGKEGGRFDEHSAVGKECGIVDEHAAVEKEGFAVDEDVAVGKEGCVDDEHAAVGKEGCVVDKYAAVGKKGCVVDEIAAVGKEGCVVDEYSAVGKEGCGVDEHVEDVEEAFKGDDNGKSASTLEKDDMSYCATHLNGLNAETSCGSMHDRGDENTANEDGLCIGNSVGRNESDKIPKELGHEDNEDLTCTTMKDVLSSVDGNDINANDPWLAKVTNKDQTPPPENNTHNQRADAAKVKYKHQIEDYKTKLDNDPTTIDNRPCEKTDHQPDVVKFESLSLNHQVGIRTLELTSHMSKNNASIYVDNGNQRLVLWNVHSKAQKSIQVGNNNILTDDDTWLKAETDHSSLESDRGYGSMESEDNSLTDHEHDFVYPDKGMSQCSTKGALMTIYLDPIKYMYIHTHVRILRLKPGSKEEHMFYQIGLGNKVDITLEGEYIICTFECFLEPVKRVLRFQIAPICYFLLRINPSKKFISMVERSRMATFDPSVKNINKQGAFLTEGMIKQDVHFASKYIPPYIDTADSNDQTLIARRLFKSSGQTILTGDSVYPYMVCSDRILQRNGAESNYGVKQNDRIDNQLYCTGEMHFDASRCPSQTHPKQWSYKEEFSSSNELKAMDILKGSNICTEPNVGGARIPIYRHTVDGLDDKMPPIIASVMQQITSHGEGRFVGDSRFDEINLSDLGTGRKESDVHLLKSPEEGRLCRNKTNGKRMGGKNRLLHLRFQRKYKKIRKKEMRRYKVNIRCFRRIGFKLQYYRKQHSFCSGTERKKDELRKALTNEAFTSVYGTGHNKKMMKEESSDQSIKGPPIKYGEDVCKNHMQDGFGRKKETYEITNQEQSRPELYGKDINTMGSLDRVKVTDDLIWKQNHDKEISLKNLSTTSDPPDHLQQYLKKKILKQLKKIPPQEWRRFLGYFHIDFHALNEDGLLCRTSHFGEINYAFQTNESAFKEFLVKMMQSVEICAGVFIKDPNDIEIDICKCGC